MLRWVDTDVSSPYGVVKTTHWAVPSSATAAHHVSYNDGEQHKYGDHDSSSEKVVQLESAEDQLGAVLWNSNTAALNYLHKRFISAISQRRAAATTTTTASSSEKNSYSNADRTTTSVSGDYTSTTDSNALQSVSARESALQQLPLTEWTVVELGAGVGCLGIALAMGGARVVVSDIKELIPLIQHNIDQNSNRSWHTHGQCIESSGRDRSPWEGELRRRCTALEWRWGASVSLSVKKAMRRSQTALTATETSVTAAATAQTSTIDAGPKTKQEEEGSVGDVAGAIANGLVTAALQPSQPWRACQAALGGSVVDCVVLCDALYGNPQDWPSLIYTLTEILHANPQHGTIINFCEQRVSDVEGNFLALLDGENDADDNCGSDAMSRGDVSAAALITRALRVKRGRYKWYYSTEVLSGVQSDLNMVIHVTQIGWTLPDGGSTCPSGTKDGIAMHPGRVSSHCYKAGREQQRCDTLSSVAEGKTTSLKRHRGETRCHIDASPITTD